MSSPPPHKRQKASSGAITHNQNNEIASASGPLLAPQASLDVSPSTPSPTNLRKRRASGSPKLDVLPPRTTPGTESSPTISTAALPTDENTKKRGRTNTPWTAMEEQRLKQMRDAGSTWSEIAKAFPTRTEGSVKKHWYKDMHWAEFGEDESLALREAIKEYESNKWKAISQKLGKPAKACEQYAREHFKNP